MTVAPQTDTTGNYLVQNGQQPREGVAMKTLLIPIAIFVLAARTYPERTYF